VVEYSVRSMDGRRLKKRVLAQLAIGQIVLVVYTIATGVTLGKVIAWIPMAALLVFGALCPPVETLSEEWPDPAAFVPSRRD
jgi:hypothetical protein